MKKTLTSSVAIAALCASAASAEDLTVFGPWLGPDQALVDIKNPGKEWIRYRVNTMLEEAYSVAEKKKDAAGMALAADKMGKYNMLDKPDADPLPFDEIVPQQFEPTDDPTVLGIKKDPNIREKKKKMLEKYNAEIEIVDVPYEEIVKPDEPEENIL